MWSGNKFGGGVSSVTLTPKSLELLNLVPEALQHKVSIGSMLAEGARNIGRESALALIRTVLAEGAKFSLSGGF